MCCMAGISSRGMPQTILNVPMTVWRVHVLHGGHRFQRHAQTILNVLMTVWRVHVLHGWHQFQRHAPDHPERADDCLVGISSRGMPRPFRSC